MSDRFELKLSPTDKKIAEAMKFIPSSYNLAIKLLQEGKGSSDWVLNRLLSVLCLQAVLIRCNWCAILKQSVHAKKCEIFLKLIPSSYFYNLFYVFYL